MAYRDENPVQLVNQWSQGDYEIGYDECEDDYSQGSEYMHLAIMTLLKRAQEQKLREEQYAKELMEARRMRIEEVEGDGNCLFRAVAYQMYGDDELH